MMIAASMTECKEQLSHGLDLEMESENHVRTPEQLRESADLFWDLDVIDSATLLHYNSSGGNGES